MFPRVTFLLLTLAVANVATAQTPAPVIVQAVPAPAGQPASANQPTDTAPAGGAALKTLQELKAANAEILTKQAAILQQLDEIQKAAEQIKIYTKRG
jgi:hypothetical protein